MKKILITGVNGLIGAHLARSLADDGWEVAGIGRMAEPVVPLNLYIPGNLLDFDWISSVCERSHFDAVIHLAVCSSVRKSIEEPRETFAINVSGTMNLLEALRQSGSEAKIILASSAEVYAHSKEALQESSALDPKSTYAVTKRIMEETAELYYRLYGLKAIALRFFYSIGPSLSGTVPATIPSGLAYRIAKLENRGTTHPLRVGTLSRAKDFIDMRDLVSACRATLLNGKEGETYNVCTGITHSFQEIVDTLARMTSVRVPIELDEMFVRPFEPSFIRGSHEKLARDTGWQPQYDILRDTLPNLLAFWRAHFSSRTF